MEHHYILCFLFERDLQPFSWSVDWALGTDGKALRLIYSVGVGQNVNLPFEIKSS